MVQLNPFPDQPKAVFFLEPILKVLGRASNYCPYEGVQADKVLDEILLEVGIDPLEPAWPVYGESPPGLYRVIEQAFQGSQGDVTHLTEAGHWSLTEVGLARAKGLEDALIQGLRVILPSTEILPPTEILPSIEKEEVLPPPKRVTPDQRDTQTWVVLELTRTGEGRVEDGSLIRAITKDLGVPSDFPVFIPSVRFIRGHKDVTLHLMEGYIFVGSGLNETQYFALERRGYVNQVMSEKSRSGMRSLSVVGNSQVEGLREKLREVLASNIKVGDAITVVEGLYTSLSGIVKKVIKDMAIIHICLRSLDLDVKLPKIFLEATED